MYKCENCEKDFEVDYRCKKTQGAIATKHQDFVAEVVQDSLMVKKLFMKMDFVKNVMSL
jgi:hypothetical protein